MKEQQGEGAEYRVDHAPEVRRLRVFGGKDFPLTRFRSRHSPSTEAIGYGKALMFFHMLRLQLGDDVFKQGIRDLYKNYKFRSASFDDLRKSFEAASGKDLAQEFEQWVMRTGAPSLKVSDANALAVQEGFILSARLEQTQPGEAYHLRIPVAVTMGGKEKAFQTVVEMNSKKMEMNLRVPGRPVRLDIDPEFDLFRRLDFAELPPAISQALGAKRMLIVLPSSASKELLQAYRELAASIGRSGPDAVEVKLDGEVQDLPADRAVTLLGWENLFLTEATANLAQYDVLLDPRSVRINQTEIDRRGHAFVFSARLPKNKDQALLFIAADRADALPGLGLKLPHYHKYSYLAFEGPEPANVAKGRWPVVDSPLTVLLPDVDGRVRKVETGQTGRTGAPGPAAHGLFKRKNAGDRAIPVATRRLKAAGSAPRGLTRRPNISQSSSDRPGFCRRATGTTPGSRPGKTAAESRSRRRS